jgi:hypothetical protein
LEEQHAAGGCDGEQGQRASDQQLVVVRGVSDRCLGRRAGSGSGGRGALVAALHACGLGLGALPGGGSLAAAARRRAAAARRLAATAAAARRRAARRARAEAALLLEEPDELEEPLDEGAAGAGWVGAGRLGAGALGAGWLGAGWEAAGCEGAGWLGAGAGWLGAGAGWLGAGAGSGCGGPGAGSGDCASAGAATTISTNDKTAARAPLPTTVVRLILRILSRSEHPLPSARTLLSGSVSGQPWAT